MNVMVPIPEDFAARFGSEADLGRRVMEALALEEYRAGRMTDPELRQVLGFATRSELGRFLKDHGVLEGISGRTPGLEPPPGPKCTCGAVSGLRRRSHTRRSRYP